MLAPPLPGLVAATAMLLCACARSLPVAPSGPQPPRAAWTDVSHPPPPARAETVPASPGPGAVWVDGDWLWSGRTWTWQPGAWVRPAPGAYLARSALRVVPAAVPPLAPAVEPDADGGPDAGEAAPRSLRQWQWALAGWFRATDGAALAAPPAWQAPPVRSAGQPW